MSFGASRIGFSVSFVHGKGGVGKSYALVRELVYQFLPETERTLFTNLPLNVDAVCEFAAKEHGVSPEVYRERIKHIPEEMCSRWVRGDGGPWEVEKEWSVVHSELWLDECHKFCPKTDGKRHKAYEAWLGEARHDGFRRILFVTQDEHKVGAVIKDHADLAYELLDGARKRLPFVGFPMSQVYELLGAFTRRVIKRVYVEEYRHGRGRFWRGWGESFVMDPRLFPLYSSYNVGHSTDSAGGGAERADKPMWQRLSRRGVCWWFFKQNPLGMAKLALLVCFFAACFTGKIADWSVMAIKQFSAHVSSLSFKNASSAGKSPPAAAAGPVVLDSAGKPIAAGGLKLSEETIVELKRLHDEADRLKRELEGARSREEGLRTERAKLSALSLVTLREVGFVDGRVFSLGETIVGGEYDGQKIAKVDFRRRSCTLSDGRVLRLGAVPKLQKSAEPPSVPAGVRAPVQRTASEPASQPAKSDGDPPADGERDRLAPGNVSSVVR
jgi:hypothetical protein